nr:hypothetical protein B0A51_06765 [Rachicladosporium sp. CCFEE 5018]
MGTKVRKLYSTVLISPAPPTLAQRNLHFNAWTASCRVLNTPELLEKILLRLPVLQLFTLERTNSVFRDTIDNPSLRQKLYQEHPRGNENEEMVADFGAEMKSTRGPRAYQYIANWTNPLLKNRHAGVLWEHLGPDEAWTKDEVGIYPDFNECEPDPCWGGFEGLEYDHCTDVVSCTITDLCSYDCEDCELHTHPRPVGIRHTQGGYEATRRTFGLHQHSEAASWQALKLLTIALPVRVEIEFGSRGLLFSPQRDPSLPWSKDKCRMDIVLSPEEATLGDVFAFWQKVTEERIRVNSGEYSSATRARLRKLKAPEEAWGDDEEWDYANNMSRD